VKFLIDANINVTVRDPLRAIFDHHEFILAHDLKWSDLADVDLFEAMKERGFSALLTHDKNQLNDPDERTALRQYGLHWIGAKPPSHGGVMGAALETAAFISALPWVLGDIEACTVPTAFHVRNIPWDRTQRVKVEAL